MTQPFNEDQENALLKALGVIALIEMIDNVNRVVAGFEIAGVFTPEGTKVLSDITSDYFNKINDLIQAERDILQAQRAQKEN